MFGTLVFGSLTIFIAHPMLALLPAALLAVLYGASGRVWPAVAAVLWASYAFYEYGMHRRWLCTGECNIRVDLLLLYPVLWIVSITAVITGVMAIRRRAGTTSPPPASP